MDRFRQAIIEKPDQFFKVISFYELPDGFVLEGERYKKRLFPDQPVRVQDWCQYKSFSLIADHPIDQLLFSRGLVSQLIADFQLLAPLYQYLCQVKRWVDTESNVTVKPTVTPSRA
ncbi:MAG TPA: hypothetical protein DDW65_08870 [Firmicutes bacterium]|jgi:hypothetical protein|nr:hypothetical protein [Bacillota bacterium]